MRKRFRRSRRRNKKQRRIMIIGVCSIFLFMSAGYAAMQTELNISAKGNVVKKATGAEAILDQVSVVTKGDGLYKDSYESNQYIYRGTNPNNYITFNNEEWRIISLNTSDNTIKIIRNESIGDQAFDTSRGIGVVALNDSKSKIIDGTIYNEIENIIFMSNFAPEPSLGGSNDWTQQVALNTYLNVTYYNDTLSDMAKNQITQSSFNVGRVDSSSSYSLSQNIEQSKSARWEGNIGLIDSIEYVKASTNNVCDSVYDFHINSSCYNDSQNYLNIIDDFWTISPYPYSGYVFYVTLGGYFNYSDATRSNGVRPVVYLSSNIQITGGEGTNSNPYTIE